MRPLVRQTPIPLPRPASRPADCSNDQSLHSANTEQPTKAASKDVRDTRDNPTVKPNSAGLTTIHSDQFQFRPLQLKRFRGEPSPGRAFPA